MPLRESRIFPWWSRQAPQRRLLAASAVTALGAVALLARRPPAFDLGAEAPAVGALEARGVDAVEMTIAGVRLRLERGARVDVPRHLLDRAKMHVRLRGGSVHLAADRPGGLALRAPRALVEAAGGEPIVLRAEADEAGRTVIAVEAGEAVLQPLAEALDAPEGVFDVTAGGAVLHLPAGPPIRLGAGRIVVSGPRLAFVTPDAPPRFVMPGAHLEIRPPAPEGLAPGILAPEDARVILQPFFGPPVKIVPGRIAVIKKRLVWVEDDRPETRPALPPHTPHWERRYVAPPDSPVPAPPDRQDRNWSRLPR